MEKNGFVSRVHRKKPKGKPMPDTVRRANAERSSPLARRACLCRAIGVFDPLRADLLKPTNRHVDRSVQLSVTG